MKLLHYLSQRVRHGFHVVSTIRPLVWISLYIGLTPVFAVVYMLLPAGQFRLPEGAGTGFGSWLYYSIVTITTLGFGDYTPAHGWAQALTAVEVMCGLVLLGFFLNAVGAMKSEVDLTVEAERQRALHFAAEQRKMMRCAPSFLGELSTFMDYCRAVTTPISGRGATDRAYNPEFTVADMTDMFKPCDRSGRPAALRLMQEAGRVAHAIDSLHVRVDLTLWPDVIDGCFAFVANYQMFSSTECLDVAPDDEARWSAAIVRTDADSTSPEMRPVMELYDFIKQNAPIVLTLEQAVTAAATLEPAQ